MGKKLGFDIPPLAGRFWIEKSDRIQNQRPIVFKNFNSKNVNYVSDSTDILTAENSKWLIGDSSSDHRFQWGNIEPQNFRPFLCFYFTFLVDIFYICATIKAYLSTFWAISSPNKIVLLNIAEHTPNIVALNIHSGGPITNTLEVIYTPTRDQIFIYWG